MFKGTTNEPVRLQKESARLARIYQLTEIEMSVTGLLLEFCAVAVLIYTRREMGTS